MNFAMKYYFYALNMLTIAEDDEGQSLAEYGLILALIAVVCIVAVRTLGTQISSYLSQLSSNFGS